MKLGKIGKLNQSVNRKLKQLFLSKGIIRCEICNSDFGLSFAHRHKRIWYRGRPGLLSVFNQVLLLCLVCHGVLETNRQLTEDAFRRLR